MELTLENEINNNDLTNDNEIESFMKELQNTLEIGDSRTSSLYKEILTEIPLASKYKEKLNDLISESMDNLSYDYDFIYFDYDAKAKTYFLDGYSEGNITRINMSPEDLKGTHFENGTFWERYDNEHVIEADYFKDNIKINVEAELESMDLKSKKKVRNK